MNRAVSVAVGVAAWIYTYLGEFPSAALCLMALLFVSDARQDNASPFVKLGDGRDS